MKEKGDRYIFAMGIRTKMYLSPFSLYFASNHMTW